MRVTACVVLTLSLTCAERVDLGYLGPRRDGRDPCVPGTARGDEVCDDQGRFRRRCTDGTLARDEVCNLRDDDCDGDVDEGYVYDVLPEPAGRATRLQASTLINYPHFVSRDDRIALFAREGVSAGDCSDVDRVVHFDLDGIALAQASIRRLPATDRCPTRLRGARSLVTCATRDYEHPGCAPPIARHACPVYSFSYDDLVRDGHLFARVDVGRCPTHALASNEAALFLYPSAPATGGAAAPAFDLVAIDDDGRVAHRAERALTIDGTKVRGAALRGRMHWLWRRGRALVHRVSDPFGRVIHALPDVALDGRAGEELDVHTAGDALVVRLEGDAPRLVELDEAGARRSEVPIDVPAETPLVVSGDQRQVYACVQRFGVAFTRFARGGARMQRLVTLGSGSSTGLCVVTPLRGGALVAWTAANDGTLSWARVGCAAAP